MNSPSEDEEKESQETQFMSDSAGFDESIELRLDTQPDNASDSQKQNSSSSLSSDEGKFTAPTSRPSLHTSNTSTDEKLFITASQDTIPLSESDDSKLGSLSLSKNLLGFEHSADSGILTPNLSVDIKPSNSQDFFVTTSSDNQTLDRLSQKSFAAFSSSTPLLRDSSSEVDSPPIKRVKLDPDVESSVEIIPKTSSSLKSDISMVSPETRTSASEKKTPQSQDSASTILLDSSNDAPAAPLPPTTESDLTLNYTQSVSQVQALSDIEALKHSSSNGVVHSTDETPDLACQKSSSSSTNSYNSHSLSYLSYDSHYESHKNSTSDLKNGKHKSEDQRKTLEKVFNCNSGPFQATIKQVFSPETNELLHYEVLKFKFSLEPTLVKDYNLSMSSQSSGALGDVSSGSSGVYSQPGPFPLQGRNVILSSSSESSGGRMVVHEQNKSERQKLCKINSKKVHDSPWQSFQQVPSKCYYCKKSFPVPTSLSVSNLNGTTNGKAQVITPDNFCPPPHGPHSSSNSHSESSSPLLKNAQEREARPSPDSPESPVTLEEILNSRDSPFSNHSIVFGFWSNNYYPCRIRDSSGDKYNVEFLDSGDVKDLSKNKLISLDMLIPGVLLKLQVSGGAKISHITGTLEQFPASDTEALFAVKVENEIKHFPIESIFIGEQQRKWLTKIGKPAQTNFSCIDLDNCTSAKRSRTPRQSTVISVPSPRTGKVSGRKLFKNTECKASTSTSGIKSPRNTKKSVCKAIIEPKSYSDSDFEFKKYQLDLSGNGIREVHLEKKDLDDPHTKDLRQKNITSFNDDQELIEKYGPIPTKGSNLFSGFVFVLSCTDGVLLKPQSESFSSGTESSQGEEFPECEYPFSKSRLMTQIKAGGGVYYENITDVPFLELKNTVLISNKPSLTCTYIYALAEGIRAYTQDNIVHCCTNSIPFSEFIKTNNYLPNGYSYSGCYKHVPKKKLVHDSLRPRLLKNRWIFLLLDPKTKKECFDFWTAILEIAGASVKREYARTGTDESPVFAIVDGSCGQDILEKKDVQCVSILWLIQTLINNTVLRPDNHRYFKYDFKTGPTDDSA